LHLGVWLLEAGGTRLVVIEVGPESEPWVVICPLDEGSAGAELLIGQVYRRKLLVFLKFLLVLA
jgi:hypothetical protein